MIIVDTDILIEIMDKKSEKGDHLLKRIVESGDTVCTTAINLHEILYGLYKYAKPIEELLELHVLDYTKKDAVLAAKLELEAEKKGTPVRRTDAMIAAIAINNNAELFTLNYKHFKPLETLGLKLF
ncbi:MAG: type II toxin-antitoxin system VapC family toxin [Candidatus Jordarchaeales archaeon]|nr:type II toxin-antitoxin system VapC family toxin [Candidatus Jordarchaeia archaeon]